jgi:hypothetical protein
LLSGSLSLLRGWLSTAPALSLRRARLMTLIFLFGLMAFTFALSQSFSKRFDFPYYPLHLHNANSSLKFNQPAEKYFPPPQYRSDLKNSGAWICVRKIASESRSLAAGC